MKKLILFATIMSFVSTLNAQDFLDNALLFSRVRPGGSARIQALGGSQVALGGDYSSGLSNPAGLGMFNRSELTFSAGLNFAKTTSDYLGTSTTDSKSVLNIPGFSLVFHRPSGRETGFIGGTFGISFSRINDFNQDFRYQGRNNDNSIIDYFIDDAANIHPDELLYDGSYFYSLTGLAYNNFLIEDIYESNPGYYYYDSQLLFTGSTQEEISQRKGATNQWSFSYGANFSDRVFVGAGIGITSLRYKLNQVYKEYDLDYPASAEEALNDFRIEETYRIEGAGVNLSIGVIARPVDFLQLGVSLVTPTYYDLTDTYNARIDSHWNNYDYYPADPDDDNLNDIFEEFDVPLISEYTLTTPMRLTTGAAFISKIGFISADVEFIDHTRTKYRSEIADDFDGENSDIKAEYKKAVNFRIGAEYRYENYRVRAGYNFMDDPLVRNNGVDRSINTFSGGLGYRTKNFYIDFAAIFSSTNARRLPYRVDGPDPIAQQKVKYSNYMITVGFPF